MRPDSGARQLEILGQDALLDDGHNPSGHRLLGGFFDRLVDGEEQRVYLSSVGSSSVDVKLQSPDWTPRPTVWGATGLPEIWQDDVLGSEVQSLILRKEACSGKKVNCVAAPADVVFRNGESLDLLHPAPTCRCY